MTIRHGMAMAACVALALAAAPNAGAAALDCSNYMQMNIEKGNCATKVDYAVATWTDPEDASITKATIATSTKRNFFIPSGKTLHMEKGYNTLGQDGDRFVVGDGGIFSIGTSGSTRTLPDLWVQAGGTLKLTANMTVNGQITIDECTAAKHATFQCGTYLDRTWYINADFVGGENAILDLPGNGSTDSAGVYRSRWKNVMRNENIRLTGDYTDFKGTISLKGYTYYKLGADFSMPDGKLSIQDYVYLTSLATSGNITIGELDFNGLADETTEGAELIVPWDETNQTCPQFVITEKLTLSGKPKIALSAMPATATHADVLKLTGNAAKSENLPDLASFVYGGKIGPWPRNAKFSIVDNDDGSKTVRIGWDALTVNKYVGTLGGISKGVANNAFDSSHAAWWSTGVVPTADYNGDILHSSDKTLEFYTTSTTPYSFPDMTAVVTGSGCFANCTDQITLKALYLHGTCNLGVAYENSGKRIVTWDMPIYVQGTVTFGGWRETYRMTRPISGNGILTMKASYYSDSESMGTHITSDTSGFHGQYVIDVYKAKSAAAQASERQGTVPLRAFKIGGDFCFGGSGQARKWDSIKFKGGQYMVVESDVTVGESTRGLHFMNYLVADVAAGKTLTLGMQMTYSGELIKAGAGRLALTHTTPIYYKNGASATTATPVANTNMLTVLSGALAVQNANAVNGLEVKFETGAKWEVDMAATGALKTGGATNTKWATPFTGPADGIELTVNADTVPFEETTTAICTVLTTATQPVFKANQRYRGRALTVTSTADATAKTTTYFLTIARRGGLAVMLK